MASKVSGVELDTTGAEVPTNRPIAFTYTAADKVATMTVTSLGVSDDLVGAVTWVRTFTYGQGGGTATTNLVGDSGWVRQ